MPVETTNGPKTEVASVRVSPLLHIPDILRELGHDPDPIVRKANLSLADFEERETEISYVVASRLLAVCLAETGCQHFGLLLAEQGGSSSLGIAGFMIRFAPNVRTALAALTRNIELHDQGGSLALAVGDKYTMWEYAVHQPDAQAVDQIYDLSVGIECKIMRELCGPNWKPTEVLLSRSPPEDTTAHKQFFRAPVRFRSAHNAIVFPTSYLAQGVDSKDPILFQHFEHETDTQRAHRPTNTIAKLRRYLQASLLDDTLTIGHIAHQLGMHERTLHRRLKEKGTSFRKQLEFVRYMAAQQMLADVTNQVSEIAVALRYSDATAFCRAFKRWSGCTPLQWRNDHLPADTGPENG